MYNIAKIIRTNQRAAEIYELMVDAVYMAQVRNLYEATKYVREVSSALSSPIFLENLTVFEAEPIFDYVVRSKH